ncbi:MAG: PA14 domain-containing protein [Myxococcota bacterium]|nr:PA14 domain-containing protein [Myxococcota bacterium]
MKFPLLLSVLLVGLCLGGCSGETGVTAPPIEPAPDVQTDTSTGIDDATTPDVAAVADVPPAQEEVQVWPGQEGGFKKGGLLATFLNTQVDSLDEVPTDKNPTHLQSELLMTVKDDPHFASFVSKGPFVAFMTGAIRVPEDGFYRLAVAAADSVNIRLDGLPIFDTWEAGDTEILEEELYLESGWHPLEIRYQRGEFKATLILYMAAAGELVSPLGPELLGFPDTPPEGTPDLLGATELGFTWSHGARIEFESSVPARLEAIGTVDDEELTLLSTGAAALSGSLIFPLLPNDTFSVEVELTDIWDRTVSFDPVEITTPEPPEYVFGGLMGSYYTGTTLGADMNGEIAEPTLQRRDPQINFPDSLLLSGNGSWETNLPNNNFSVRWDGAVWVKDPGTYTLYLGTNDGGRLHLDGEQVIDNWIDHQFLSFEGYTVDLYTGWHTLSVEMYESTDLAEARLDWEGPTFSRSLIPPHHLATVLPDEDGKTPEVTDFVINAGGNGDGSVNVTFAANELCTATVVINTADGNQTSRKFNHYSTGFHAVIGGDDSAEGEMQCGIATAQVKLTDQSGKKGYTDAKPVLIAGDDCEEDDN